VRTYQTSPHPRGCNGYNRLYWSARYPIDTDGFIRYRRFGEGTYDENEEEIQELLAERDEISSWTVQFSTLDLLEALRQKASIFGRKPALAILSTSATVTSAPTQVVGSSRTSNLSVRVPLSPPLPVNGFRTPSRGFYAAHAPCAPRPVAPTSIPLRRSA
jgi:hypothetical protein